MKKIAFSCLTLGLIAALSAFGAGRGAKNKGGATSPTTFSGEAIALDVFVAGVVDTEFAHAGPLPPEGGADEATLLEAHVPGVADAAVLHASTVAQQDVARSEASVADAGLVVAGNTITATLLRSQAEARCVNGAAQLSGSSEVVGLTINGQAVNVSGQPNQTITLNGLRIVINEQTATASGNFGAITVTALHVTLTGLSGETLADVAVSTSHADIACGQTGPCHGDFVTGGGWITGTPSGAKGTFGIAGGIKQNGLWGHLTYIDHGSGLKVKGTGVTGYEPVDAVTRRITGTCEVNGVGGHTYEAIVSDRGEPGRNDMLSLRLSTGYAAGGNLNGGNIQLHVCK
jgi:hypothetical protein